MLAGMSKGLGLNHSDEMVQNWTTTKKWKELLSPGNIQKKTFMSC